MLSKRSILFVTAGLLINILNGQANLFAQVPRSYRIGVHSVSSETGKSYNQVVSLQKAQKFKEAEPIAEALSKSAPSIPEIQCIYGEILVKVGKVEQAHTIAKKLTESMPDDPRTWSLMGNTCLYSGRKAEALSAYKKYISLANNANTKVQASGLITLLSQEIADEKKNQIISPPGTYLSAATVYGVIRWTSDKMPLKVFIKDGSSIRGYQSSFIDVLKESFGQWQERSDNTVSFTFVETVPESDIEVYWSDDKAKLYNPSEGGHTVFVDSPTGRVHSEIVLLTIRGDKTETDEAIRFRALHEIGHALGIAGHSNHIEDIMYMGETDKVHALTDADINTLKALYKLAPTPRTASKLEQTLSLSHSDNPLNKAILLNQEGGNFFKQGKFQESAESFRKAIKMAPSLTIARENLAVALNGEACQKMKSGDFKGAEKSLLEAIKCEENDPKLVDKLKLLLTNYEIVLKNMKRNDEAKMVAERRQSLKTK